MIDNNTGKVLHARNADAPRYPASLTKIMTLYLVFQEIKAGRLSLDQKLVVTANAASKPPSKIGVKAGQKITVRNAIRALVTKSANDVAAVIAENFAGSEERFAEVMTSTAHSIGMRNTTFKNASGLPNRLQRTTARDMATLSQRIMDDFPKLFKFFKTRHFKYRGKRYRNHNSLLFNYRGTNGIKTGYTRASGFNLTSSVHRGKKHLVAVVMGSRSARKRNAHMRYLLNRSWKRASKYKTRKIPRSRPAPVPAPAPELIAKNKAVPSLNAQAQQVAGRNNTRRGFVTAAASPAPTVRATAHVPTAVAQGSATQDGPYHVQIGAFGSISEADARLFAVHAKGKDLLLGHAAITLEVPMAQGKLYRARFSSFSEHKARSTCKQLRRRGFECMAMRAE